MNYFTVRQNNDIAEIVNPKGQVFCSVFMGKDMYEILTKKRAEEIARILNKEMNLIGLSHVSTTRCCESVGDLEDAISFVNDECRLASPVFVTYEMQDGEGFIRIQT